MPVQLTSRRVFLKGMLGAGAGWALRGGKRSYRADSTGPVRVEPAQWAFVADTHISEKPDGDGPRQQMSGQFRAVLADILNCPGRLEGMLINGDVAHARGLTGDYAALVDLLEPARRAELDLHLIPGNHDDRSNLLHAFFGEAPPAARVADRYISVVDSGGVRMIMLDSLIRPNHTPGELGPDQLGWLKDTIDADPVQPCVLFLHHYPRGSNQALLDEQAFRDIVLPRRQVKAVFQGHSHEHQFRVDGRPALRRVAGYRLCVQGRTAHRLDAGPSEPIRLPTGTAGDLRQPGQPRKAHVAHVAKHGHGGHRGTAA